MYLASLEPKQPLRIDHFAPLDYSDALIRLAAARSDYVSSLQRRKAGSDLDAMPAPSTDLHYYRRRRAAMRPVELPFDDAHLMVSPETAAYFNARAAA